MANSRIHGGYPHGQLGGGRPTPRALLHGSAQLRQRCGPHVAGTALEAVRQLADLFGIAAITLRLSSRYVFFAIHQKGFDEVDVLLLHAVAQGGERFRSRWEENIGILTG